MRNSKRCGELIEIAFLHKAADMGFAVTKPYGDSEAYDFIVDAGNRLWRVQVKSGSSMVGQAYSVVLITGRVAKKTKISYTPEQIDILAAYVVPLESLVHHPGARVHAPERIFFVPAFAGTSWKVRAVSRGLAFLACLRGGRA